jgi:hypothetical protein
MVEINTTMAAAFEKGLAQRAARMAEQPTRYERQRDRILAEIRFNVGKMIAEFAGEAEIEGAVEDVIYALRTQNFLGGLRGWMTSPAETSLATAVAWRAERRENDPNPIPNTR